MQWLCIAATILVNLYSCKVLVFCLSKISITDQISNARSTIMSTTNFSTLFLKLWKEIPIEETKKKLDPHTKITPIARQKDLLMYVGFKDYKNPLEFSTFEDCNEFVNKWATRHQDFKLKHGAKPITSEFFLFLSSWNFYSHQSLKL